MENSENIKNIIRSLLTSNPMNMTIAKLCQDYREFIGGSIPYRQFKFQNIEDFLRSLTDTCRVLGNGLNARLYLVPSEKSEHIDKLVSVQKKELPKYHRGIRFTLNRRRVALPISRAAPRQSVNESAPSTSVSKPSCSIYSPYVSYAKNNNIESDKKEIRTHDELIKNHNESDSESETHYEKEEMQHLHVQKEHQVEELNENYETQSQSSVLSRRIPSETKDNFKKLLNMFPNGILTSQFMMLYEKQFKKRLYYEQCNYTSLIEMCADLSDICGHIRVNSYDFVLYDSSRKNMDFRQYVNDSDVGGMNEDFIQYNETEEAPFDFSSLDWAIATMFAPPDVVHLGDFIPREFVYHIEEEKYLKVVIAEIYDPSKFYIYIHDGNLNELMCKIQDFYNNEKNRQRIPSGFIEEGLYCSCPFGLNYHRAIIVDTLPDVPDKVRVLYIDYGTVGNVDVSQIFYLKKKFAELKCQAIRASLNSIYPPVENMHWSLNSKLRFRELVKNKPLCAEVMSIDKENHILDIYLADLSDMDNIVFINDILVKEGYARYTDEERAKVDLGSNYKPLVEYIHLYPTFWEIEYGSILNESEYTYLTKRGVTIEQCYSHYYYHKVFDNPAIKKFEEHKKRIKATSNVSNILESKFLLSQIKDINIDLSLFFKKIQNKNKQVFEVATDRDPERDPINTNRLCKSIRNLYFTENKNKTNEKLINSTIIKDNNKPNYRPIFINNITEGPLEQNNFKSTNPFFVNDNNSDINPISCDSIIINPNNPFVSDWKPIKSRSASEYSLPTTTSSSSMSDETSTLTNKNEIKIIDESSETNTNQFQNTNSIENLSNLNLTNTTSINVTENVENVNYNQCNGVSYNNNNQSQWIPPNYQNYPHRDFPFMGLPPNMPIRPPPGFDPIPAGFQRNFDPRIPLSIPPSRWVSPPQYVNTPPLLYNIQYFNIYGNLNPPPFSYNR